MLTETAIKLDRSSKLYVVQKRFWLQLCFKELSNFQTDIASYRALITGPATCTVYIPLVCLCTVSAKSGNEEGICKYVWLELICIQPGDVNYGTFLWDFILTLPWLFFYISLQDMEFELVE